MIISNVNDFSPDCTVISSENLESKMSILVLTYELNREYDDNFDYHHFYKIRDSYKPVQISEYSFVLRTAETPSQVRHNLQKHLHPDDNIFVFTVQKPYSSRGFKTAIEWLDVNLSV